MTTLPVKPGSQAADKFRTDNSQLLSAFRPSISRATIGLLSAVATYFRAKTFVLLRREAKSEPKTIKAEVDGSAITGE